MNKKISSFIAACAMAALPSLAFAATPVINCPGNGRTICDLAKVAVGYFNVALVVMMSFSIVMFTWYVIQYYIKPNEERKNAAQYVMYSVIGFFVIISIWGLVNILSNTFGGLDNTSNSNTLQNLPLFPTS